MTAACEIPHPWLANRTLKRKQRSPSDYSSTPTLKRRRYHTLEHGFASLDLNTAVGLSEELEVQDVSGQALERKCISQPTTVPLPSPSSALIAYQPVVRPASVEEPSSFIGEDDDVEMDDCESDINVTDIDEQSQEAELIVSPALLKRIEERSRTGLLLGNVGRKNEENRALVLYKPPEWINGAEARDEEQCIAETPLAKTEDRCTQDDMDNAMQVES